MHNQLLVLQGHLIRSVFKRLVLKVWETVVYYMWNWLVPSCPRHNYITERCMPSPVEATVPDELDDIGGGTGGHGHKRRGSIMRWLGKKMRSTKKRRAKADEMALQPHQVYIMNQAYPALVRYFSAKGTLFPESVLSGVAAPLSDLLALYDVAPDRLFAEMGTLISQAVVWKGDDPNRRCRDYVHPSTKLSFVHIRALLLHRSVYPSGKTEAEATLAAQFCEETAAWM